MFTLLHFVVSPSKMWAKRLNKTKVQKLRLEIIFLLSKLTRILIPKIQGILGFVSLFLFCFNFLFVEQMCGSLTAVIVTLTFGSTREGKWGLLDATPTTSRFFFFNFIKRILSEELSISIAFWLSWRHTYCKLGRNQRKYKMTT